MRAGLALQVKPKKWYKYFFTMKHHCPICKKTTDSRPRMADFPVLLRALLPIDGPRARGPRRRYVVSDPIFDEEDIPRIADRPRSCERTETKTMTPSTEPAAPAPKATFCLCNCDGLSERGFLKPASRDMGIVGGFIDCRGVAPLHVVFASWEKGLKVAIGKTRTLDNGFWRDRWCSSFLLFAVWLFSGLARGCAPKPADIRNWSE